MFGKLKKAFSGLLKKSKEASEKPKAEEKVEEKKVVKTPKKEEKKKPKAKESKNIEEEIKEKADEIEETVPQKFETGSLSYKPDTKEIKEEIEEAIEEAEEESQEKPEEKKGFFSKLKEKLTTSELKQDQFDDLFEDLRIILLENNVALETTDKIAEELSKNLVGISVKKEEVEEKIHSALKESILSVLQEPPNLLEKIKESEEPYPILFFGINGVGKTTSIAKLANKLKENNISCVLASADTFRSAAIEQLEIHANKIQVPIIKSQYEADPASVAFDAIAYAKKNKIQAVLIDTAGRMHTKSNLIKEMEKIVRVSKPKLKLFVAESITGNDAIQQAQTFNEAIGIDGIILNKADVDEKAGTILSVSHITNKPIYFLGTGQEYKDLQDFKKETVLKNLGLE